MPEIDDPVQRFVAVVKFYLSGWHIKPPLVRHPHVASGVLTMRQWCQEATQSDSWGEFLRLLELQGWYKRLLYLGADVTPPTEV